MRYISQPALPDIKGATAHVKHQHCVSISAAIDAIGQSCCHRLLQELHLRDARQLRRRMRGRLLRLAKVGGHGDHLRQAGSQGGSSRAQSGNVGKQPTVFKLATKLDKTCMPCA